jgi:hypothetical protein
MQKSERELGMMAQAYNPITLEAEADYQIQGQSEQHRKTLSKKIIIIRKEK